MPLDGDDFEIEKRLHPVLGLVLALGVSLLLWAGIISVTSHPSGVSMSEPGPHFDVMVRNMYRVLRRVFARQGRGPRGPADQGRARGGLGAALLAATTAGTG